MDTKRIMRLFGAAACLLLLALFASAPAMAGNGDESIIFLHHSTGGGVYWDGDVEGWFENYNNKHGTSYSITEREYPNDPYPWENYPYDYWNLWVNNACSNNPNIECLDSLAANFDVIIFKHCFPGAQIEEGGGSGDVSSDEKNLPNYKAQYRALRDMMDSYPDTQFIVWTLAPLHRKDTSSSNAARAREFVEWVKKDFLTEDGKPHPNIHIFDFFGIVAETNPDPSQGEPNTLRYEYEGSHSDSDSHPNEKANRIAGPKFAEFIVSILQ